MERRGSLFHRYLSAYLLLVRPGAFSLIRDLWGGYGASSALRQSRPRPRRPHLGRGGGACFASSARSVAAWRRRLFSCCCSWVDAGRGQVVVGFGGSGAPVSSSSHGVRVVRRFQWGLLAVVRKAWVKALSCSIGRSTHSVVSSMLVGGASRAGLVAGVSCPHSRMKATSGLRMAGPGGVRRDGAMVTMTYGLVRGVKGLLAAPFATAPRVCGVWVVH